MSEVYDESARPLAEAAGHSAPLVVGIGAAGGGIDALKRFLAGAHTDAGVAYIVVPHLPDSNTKLVEALRGTTSLPVEAVRGRVPVRADTVYIIAAESSFTIDSGDIVAVPLTNHQRRARLDLAFRTIAESYGHRAVSIVLSGTGRAGSSGLKHVKEHGGLTIAQDPKDAECGEMPRNAIASGSVDHILSVANMPAAVREFHQRLRRIDVTDSAVGHLGADGDTLRSVMALLRTRTGHDFSKFHPFSVLRRVRRRLSVVGVSTLPDYLKFMHLHPEEATVLSREVLYRVARFFRDGDALVALERQIVPQLLREGAKQPVRVWIAGCGTGEEAYSIAMLLAECAATMDGPPPVEVFASDLDEESIAIARAGLYSDSEVADVSEARVRRFFSREATGYRIRRELREIVLFSHHDIIKEPPFLHLDLVVCRSLLSHLNRSIQESLVQTFHYALRPGGYLLVAAPEPLHHGSRLFVPVDQENHIYQSRALASGLFRPHNRDSKITRNGQLAFAADSILPIEIHHQLLEEYAPPSLVVTEDYQLLHVSRRAVRYLQVPAGEPSRDILSLIHTDLQMDLRAALYQAGQRRTTVVVRDVHIKNAHQDETVTLHVRPVLRDDGERSFFLIVFATRATPGPAGAVSLPSEMRAMARPVENDLGVAIQHLHAVNEELRSSTEALEASKRELESLNQELNAINQELTSKIDELRLTNNDFRNFIHATNISTIFLDRHLHVKLATVPARESFDLGPADIGRPLSHIARNINYEGVCDDAAEVLEHLQTIEREIQSRDGRLYLMRVLPYRTIDDHIEGVVLTFVDVTGLRRAEAAVVASESRLGLLIESAADYAIFMLDHDGRVESWNTGAQRMFGYEAETIVGRHVDELFTVEERETSMPRANLDRARAEGRSLVEGFRRRRDGTVFYARDITTRLGSEGSLGFAKIVHDLTTAREAAESLQRAHAELEERVRLRTGELQQEQARVRRLLHRLVSVQEEQKAKLARDLHDQFGQQLTALRLALERAQQQAAAGQPCQSDLERGLATAADLDARLDFTAWELRPSLLDDFGLAAALPRFVREWTSHCGLQAEVHVTAFRNGDLSKDAEIVFYRIAQESLTNVLKHAHASRVDVVLETRDGVVMMVVSDDGVGFDTADPEIASSGFGLMGMQERASLVGATLVVESAPRQGTTVYLRAPRQETI